MKDLTVAMQLQQRFNLEQQTLDVVASNLEEVRGIDTGFLKGYLPTTLFGIPIELDESVPLGTIEFRNGNNETIGEIRNLKLNSGAPPTQDSGGK